MELSINPFLYIPLLFAVNFLISGGPEPDIRSGLVGKLLLADSLPPLLEPSGEGRLAEGVVEAEVQMGIRRRSKVVGGIYDYFRTKGKGLVIRIDLEATARVEVKRDWKDTYLLVEVMNGGREKCTGDVWVRIKMEIDFENLKIGNGFLFLEGSRRVAVVETGDEVFYTDANAELSIYYDMSNEMEERRATSISFRIFIQEIKEDVKNTSINEVYISSKGSFYKISSLIYCFFSVILKTYMIYSAIISYFMRDQQNYKFIGHFVILFIIPLMYMFSLLELKALNEVCPLNISLILYLILTLFVLIPSLFMTLCIYLKFKNFEIWNREFENIVYSLVLINFTLVLYLINYILPEWISFAFQCLNLRILFFLLAPNTAMIVIANAITKNRDYIFFSNFVITILIDLIIFTIQKCYLEMIFIKQSEFALVQIMLLLAFNQTLSCIQYAKGTRFFLPNICRTKLFDYRRRIAEDFDFARIDKSEWPQCDLCLQKLNQQSLLTENKSLSQIEGIQCYGEYIRCHDGKKFHYFCIQWAVSSNISQLWNIYQIDAFDD